MKPLKAFILAVIEVAVAIIILHFDFNGFQTTRLFLYLWLVGLGLVLTAMITLGIALMK